MRVPQKMKNPNGGQPPLLEQKDGICGLTSTCSH